MTGLLVSVRDADEALAAARAGADFIDLKDPAAGALGGLPPERIVSIVTVLRAAHPGVPVSATIGDVPASECDTILRRVAAVAACGVDFVKVGIVPGAQAAGLLCELRRCRARVVPVLLADEGVDFALVGVALESSQTSLALTLALSQRERELATEACAAPTPSPLRGEGWGEGQGGRDLTHSHAPATPLQHAFPALMLDTTDKRGGSLLDRIEPHVLARFVTQVQAGGRLAGLAGALRADDVPLLCDLAPDFAGFRSAVCASGRASALDPARVRDLRGRLSARARQPTGLLLGF